MGLPTLLKVEELQAALHAKAKRSPEFCFYSLYDKVYRRDVLWQAYQQCRHNGGAPGVDGATFADIEKDGLEKWLGELAEELRTKQYRPQAVRRVYIPKPNGKQRPLCIPTVKDRVVQTAAMLVLSPSSRPTCRTSSMRTDRDAAPRTHWFALKNWYGPGTRR
jgi:retron-type reverse transcriptase